MWYAGIWVCHIMHLCVLHFDKPRGYQFGMSGESVHTKCENRNCENITIWLNTSLFMCLGSTFQIVPHAWRRQMFCCHCCAQTDADDIIKTEFASLQSEMNQLRELLVSLSRNAQHLESCISRRAIKQGRSRLHQMRADGVQYWMLCNVSTSAAVARYAQAVNTLEHRATAHNTYLISNESDCISMSPTIVSN